MHSGIYAVQNITKLSQNNTKSSPDYQSIIHKKSTIIDLMVGILDQK